MSDAAFNFGARDFTVQIWVNFNGHTHEQTLIEKFSGEGGPGWTLTTPNNSYQFYTDATGPVDSPPGITTGVWHYVVARRRGNIFDLYVDGTVVGSGRSTKAIGVTDQPLLLGKRHSGRYPVDGRLEEAAIWGRALPNHEIATYWNEGRLRSNSSRGGW
jgi:hypothetical protein